MAKQIKGIKRHKQYIKKRYGRVHMNGRFLRDNPQLNGTNTNVLQPKRKKGKRGRRRK